MVDGNPEVETEVKKERKINNPIVLGLYYLFFGIFIALWKFLKWSYVSIIEGYRKYYPTLKEKTIAYKVWLFKEVKENFKPAAKMSRAMLSVLVLFIFFWFMFLAPLISPLFMSEKPDIYNVQSYEGVGISTINAIQKPLENISSGILMTNFYGVRFWNDNRYNQQIGQFEMYKNTVQSIRDFLGRNRSSNGANKFLIFAHQSITTDSNALLYPNYDYQISKTIRYLEKYKLDLEDDRDKEADEKTAIFIVNSDNLADVLFLLRKNLMTEADTNKGITLLNADNDYYRLRGSLIALYQFLAGIEADFKVKMMEKDGYKDNYIPLIKMIKETVEVKPFFVMEAFRHDVSTLRGKAQAISTKMAELANRLKNG